MNPAANYPHLRVTRRDLYSHECTGRDDPSVRQGHYFHDTTPISAVAQMATRYPGEDFDVQLGPEGEAFHFRPRPSFRGGPLNARKVIVVHTPDGTKGVVPV